MSLVQINTPSDPSTMRLRSFLASSLARKKAAIAAVESCGGPLRNASHRLSSVYANVDQVVPEMPVEKAV